MRLVLRGAVLFICLLSLGVYTAFKERGSVKASREIASLSKSINLLSLKELSLLDPKDLKGYTGELSITMAKASFLKGSFQAPAAKTSFQIKLIEEAYALVLCPIQGLHPAQKNLEADCSKQIRGIIISENAVLNFKADRVRSSDRALRCPDGKNMCSPAMVGFDFSEDKPQLRCLADASNKNCSELKTTGEDMKRSLELLTEGAPEFWKEFEEGVNAACFENGVFKESEGCKYVRDQMNRSTSKYRNKLTLEYKNLAAKLGEASERTENSGKACKPFQREPDNELGVADHRNFNVPGQKIIVSKGRCYRVPADTIVSRVGNFYRFMQPGKEDPVLIFPVGGIGADPDRVGSVSFYNFKCGPCNGAQKINMCIFQHRKPKSERLPIEQLNKVTDLNMDDCRAHISDLETRELPKIIFDKVNATGQSFYDARSIN